MDVRGFHHIALKVWSLETTAAFYRDVLGLHEQRRHHLPDGKLRSIWLDVPGGGFIALEQASTEPSPEDFAYDRAGYFLLALRITAEARRGVMAELARRDIAVVHQTKWTLYFRDPEGNRVALSHHPDDALA